MPTDSQTAMQTIDALEQRWPGFLDYVKASNGHPVSSFTYDDFLRIHIQMLLDDDGVQLLTKALESLFESHTGDPAVAAWLQDRGFFSHEMTLVQEELERIMSQMPHATGEEREALGRRIREIRSRAEEMAERSHGMTGGLDGEM